MEVTEKNCRVADKIIEILVNEKCTVEETQDILSEVTREVRRTSTVQAGRKLSKVYHNYQERMKGHPQEQNGISVG